MRWSCLIVLIMASAFVFAQEGQLQADFRHEGDHIKENCGKFGFKGFANCAQELVTDHPLHLALGSIAPQNGFGFGPAFVTHYTPNESWRLSWNADAVGAISGAWRAGAYMKIIHTPVSHIVPVAVPAGTKPKKSNLTIHPYTVFNIYAQAISLPKLFFFGLGPDTQEAGKSVFGMRQTIVGGNAIVPVPKLGGLNLSLLGEVNGRFVSLRGNHDDISPSIEQLYTNTNAPGLANQPGFLQLGEGVRIKPILFDDHLQMNYLVNFQQFFAPSDSTYNFRRWTVDLDHQFPLYRNTHSTAPKDTNGPDECLPSPTSDKCPDISYSRNRDGSIGFRLFISESAASAGNVVPFYFQHTLGGSDIMGNPGLSSYQDYRFRGPNLLLLRESFEHSIWGPFGFTFMADQGKVALKRGDVDFSDLKHSFATGFTLRAGGFPQVYLLFAWGGNEGHHTIGSLNTSLLGGSGRPSLF